MLTAIHCFYFTFYSKHFLSYRIVSCTLPMQFWSNISTFLAENENDRRRQKVVIFRRRKLNPNSDKLPYESVRTEQGTSGQPRPEGPRAAVTPSRQHPNSVSTQYPCGTASFCWHPAYSGPLAVETPSGQQPYSASTQSSESDDCVAIETIIIIIIMFVYLITT